MATARIATMIASDAGIGMGTMSASRILRPAKTSSAASPGLR